MESRGRGGFLQTDSFGNSGVAGVQPSIKCNLMLWGMFTCYVRDSPFALHEFPVPINDLMVSPPPSTVGADMHQNLSKCVLGRSRCPSALPMGPDSCACVIWQSETWKNISLSWSCLPTHICWEHLWLWHKKPGSISICNIGNLLDVFKLLAVELLKGPCFWSASGTESLSH